jgi:hypothetical protein
LTYGNVFIVNKKKAGFAKAKPAFFRRKKRRDRTYLAQLVPELKIPESTTNSAPYKNKHTLKML